jgi:hypothetical protein
MNGKIRIRLFGPETLSGLRGWNYELTRDGVHIGGGWSAGKKRDAQDEALRACREHGWEVA